MPELLEPPGLSLHLAVSSLAEMSGRFARMMLGGCLTSSFSSPRAPAGQSTKEPVGFQLLCGASMPIIIAKANGSAKHGTREQRGPGEFAPFPHFSARHVTGPMRLLPDYAEQVVSVSKGVGVFLLSAMIRASLACILNSPSATRLDIQFH